VNFASDNTAPVSPDILRAVTQANEGAMSSYGADVVTARLRDAIHAVFERPVLTFPVATGTAANALALATLVRPFGAVICGEEAHSIWAARSW
jgi:threonine aldolase